MSDWPPDDMPGRFELVAAGFALLALLGAQLVASAAVQGANYVGGDGQMAQALVRGAFEFGGRFDVTSISPLQGVGSQMLPKNVWANPAFWPFAFLDLPLAADVSAALALACFATGCYIMVRCFGLPVVPSAIAAQSCIVLFAPLNMAVHAPNNFTIIPGDAVVYAPHMVALGLLARLPAESRRGFVLTAAAIFALLLYSLCCDPLWSMVSGVAWSVAFSVVVFAPLRRRGILVRVAALGCCVVALFLTQAPEYLYTVSQYTARVQFADVLDRPRGARFASSGLRTWSMVGVYIALATGWLIGLRRLRGRPRVLVIATTASFAGYVIYCSAYALVSAAWVVPLPIYVEHGLFSLFLAGAVAGYWSWFEAAAPTLARARIATALVAAAIIPVLLVASIEIARTRAIQVARRVLPSWPNQPELRQFLSGSVGLALGRRFNGSVDIPGEAHATTADLWIHGIPTANEYSQAVTPQAVYFIHALLKRDVRYDLNRLTPWPGESAEALRKTLQLIGVRYVLLATPLSDPRVLGSLVVTAPRREASGAGLWYVYEIPRPNIGDLSPTDVVVARSGAEIMARIAAPAFDATRQAVLLRGIDEPLDTARDLRLTVIRGGWHVSGRSSGTSLVVLPQQFSNCLRARDDRVRLVRANLMLTGLIFSGDLDTDIRFDYGIFSPSCRRADLADMERLALKVTRPR